MTGPIELETPDGRELILQRLPAGRGWRCCASDDTPHYLVPARPSLREALTEALPGLDEDDPWLLEELGARGAGGVAPQRLRTSVSRRRRAGPRVGGSPPSRSGPAPMPRGAGPA